MRHSWLDVARGRVDGRVFMLVASVTRRAAAHRNSLPDAEEVAGMFSVLSDQVNLHANVFRI